MSLDAHRPGAGSGLPCQRATHTHARAWTCTTAGWIGVPGKARNAEADVCDSV